MSAIPPNPIASVLQTAGAQREAAKPIDAAAAEEAKKAKTFSAGPDAILEIESTDADTQVHTDSGGLGSQGRQDAQPEDETLEDVNKETPPGITLDKQGRPHLDLSV